MVCGAPPVRGTTCTVPSGPAVTFELTVVSPDWITMASSVENVFTLARSTVTSPRVSVLMTSFPPVGALDLAGEPVAVEEQDLVGLNTAGQEQ
jgi:hypothetical protein